MSANLEDQIESRKQEILKMQSEIEALKSQLLLNQSSLGSTAVTSNDNVTIASVVIPKDYSVSQVKLDSISELKTTQEQFKSFE
jgi:hypothetical protein